MRGRQWQNENCKQCGGKLPCIPCRDARVKRWHAEHREGVREIKDAHVAKYPERKKESQHKYYHEGNGRNSLRLYKGINRDKINARYREQYAQDPTPFIVRAQRRDAREKAACGSFTDADRNALFVAQNGCCANPFCKTDLSITGFHADHKTPIVLGGSHDPSNRQLLCQMCNHRKGTMTNTVWLAQQKERSA